MDKYYIRHRYPNGFDEGMSEDYFTKDDAAEAIKNVRRVIDFRESYISE